MKEKLPIFRIGIYGQISSGKTVYLTSLAMPRIQSLQGLSVTLVSPKEKADFDNIKKRTSAEFSSFKDGYAPILEAMKSLEKGTPPKNTIALEHPFRYLFKISKSEPENTDKNFQCYVELIDYSGELMDEGTVDVYKSQLLHKLLRESDGFFIFAKADARTMHSANLLETAGPGTGRRLPPVNANAALAAQLLALQKLFVVNEARRREFAPVAMLVTKWDRRSTIDVNDRDKEDEKLRAYIDTSDGHANLRDAIIGVIGEKNFHIFPVSALGRAKLAEGADPNQTDPSQVPEVPSPLPSLNVAEAIFWIVERSQAMRLERFEAAASNSKRYKFWQLLSIDTHRSGWEAQRACAVTPAFRERLEKSKQRVRAAKFGQAITLALILLLSPSIGMGLIDFFESRRIRAFSTIRPNYEESQNSKAWLEHYISVTHWNRYLRAVSHVAVLSPKEADVEIERIQADLKPDTQRKKIKYFITMSNHWLNEAKMLLSADAPAPDAILSQTAKLQSIGVLPSNFSPQVSSEDDTNYARSIVFEIDAIKKKLEEKLPASAVSRADQKLLSGDVISAIMLIGHLSDRDNELVQRWIQSFPRVSRDAIKSKVDDYLKTSKNTWKMRDEWRAALSYVTTIRNNTLVAHFTTGDVAFNHFLTDQEARLHNARDREIYQAVIEHWNDWYPGEESKETKRAVKEYLDIEESRYRNVVENALGFIRRSEIEATGVKVLVHGISPKKPLCVGDISTSWSFQYILTGKLYDTKLLEKSFLTASEDGYINMNDTFEKNILLKREGKLHLTLERKSTAIYKSCGKIGEFEGDFTWRRLMSTKSLPLIGEDFRVIVDLEFSLVDEKPELPEWR